MRHLLRPRWARITVATVLAVLLLLAVDLIVLSSRIDTWEVAMPKVDDGVETWVLVGTDSREHTPQGTSQSQFGTADEVQGERADIVVLLTVRGDDVRAVTVPRDLRMSDDGYPTRLALTLLKGPQHLVDSLCTTLGVPADHLLALHFDGFVRIVDTLGGVDVTIAHPMRDPLAGLDLPEAGELHLNGLQTLALIRSRSGEQLVDGSWQPIPEGADERTKWSGIVLDQLTAKISDARFDALTLQRLAWVASGALRTDQDTGLLDLASLRGMHPDLSELPHGEAPGTAPDGKVLPLPVTEETHDAIDDLGLDGQCTPAS